MNATAKWANRFLWPFNVALLIVAFGFVGFITRALPPDVPLVHLFDSIVVGWGESIEWNLWRGIAVQAAGVIGVGLLGFILPKFARAVSRTGREFPDGSVFAFAAGAFGLGWHLSLIPLWAVQLANVFALSVPTWPLKIAETGRLSLAWFSGVLVVVDVWRFLLHKGESGSSEQTT